MAETPSVSADAVGGNILKSCRYCGRIHSDKFNCGKKPQQVYAGTRSDAVAFRNRKIWRRKANEIRERDLQLCRVCLMNGKYVYNNLSVHHIIPLDEDFERRLDNDNLITLCHDCHVTAEENGMERGLLFALAQSPPVI